MTDESSSIVNKHPSEKTWRGVSLCSDIDEFKEMRVKESSDLLPDTGMGGTPSATWVVSFNFIAS